MRPALPELAGFYVDSVLLTSFRCYYERRGCGCVSSDRVSVVWIPIYPHNRRLSGLRKTRSRANGRVTVCPIKNSSFQLKLNLLQSKLQSSRDPVCGPYLAAAFTGKLPLPPLTRQLPGAWKGRGSRADALTCDQGGIFSLPKHDIITYGRVARAYQTTNY